MSNHAQVRPQQLYRPSQSSTPFHFFAGLSTGILSAALLQPADLLKTRVQQSHSTTLVSTLRSILTGPDVVRTLWRGTVPSIIRTGAGSALYFSTLNTLRHSFVHETNASSTRSSASSLSSSLPQISRSANLVAGATARAFAGFLLMPITVIKVRCESSLYGTSSGSASLLPSARSIYAQAGLRGFFAGFGATAMRDAPYAGLYVLFYEEAKTMLGRLLLYQTGEETSDHSVSSFSRSVPIHFSSGLVAAAAATLVTNPFDAIKTRLQLMPQKYRNSIQAARLMITSEGWASLMDGVGLRMSRKALSSALAWSVYEELVRTAELRLADR